MERIARFYKVSREQFVQDWKDTFGEGTEEAQILEIYEGHEPWAVSSTGGRP